MATALMLFPLHRPHYHARADGLCSDKVPQCSRFVDQRTLAYRSSALVDDPALFTLPRVRYDILQTWSLRASAALRAQIVSLRASSDPGMCVEVCLVDAMTRLAHFSLVFATWNLLLVDSVSGYLVRDSNDPCTSSRGSSSAHHLPINEELSPAPSTQDAALSSGPYGDDGLHEMPIPVENGGGTLRLLGGQALSRPCCTSWGPARVDCFIRGPTSNVLHMSIDNGEYSEWEDLQGTIVGEIECVSRAVGIISVLVLDTTLGLCIKTYSEGQWSDWVSKGGKLMEVPSCVARTPAIVNCLLRDIHNTGHIISEIIGTWGNYFNIDGTLWSTFVGSSRSHNILDNFAIATDLHLWVRSWIEPKWIGWTDLGVLMTSRPSVTTWDKNRIDVFALGVKNNVVQKTFDGSWKEEVDLGGVFDSAPECVTTGVGRIHCFAIGANSYLYRNEYHGEKWSGWISTSIPFSETPSCVVSRRHEVSCYLRGFDKQVFEVVFHNECFK